MDDLTHILPNRRNLALFGSKQRIKCIYKDCWVNHPQVGSVRAVVRSVYDMPHNAQAQCILVSGRPGMGKTSLFNKIQSDIESLRKRQENSFGCISFSLPPDPNLRTFEGCLGEALGVSIGRIRNGVIPREFGVFANLRNIRIVLIDEVHNLLNAGRIDQRKNLAFLRALSSQPFSLSIIAFGVDDAVHAISSDEQLERRFQIYDLPRWKENDSFRSFLSAYESTLPLRRPSELWGQEKVKFLLSTTDGITDAIVKRITRGAVWAILDGKETIDLDCLQKAAHIPTCLAQLDNEA